MIYSRCLYHIALCADAAARAAYPVRRSELRGYLRHVCSLSGVSALAAGVGDGFVRLLVDIGTGVSVDEFVSRLKRWSSVWIAGDESLSYWSPGYYAAAVSPEDRAAAAAYVATDTPACDIDRWVRHTGLIYIGDEMPTQPRFCHHFIFLTSRYRQLLRWKYSALISEAVIRLAEAEGCEPLGASSARNHIHLLCLSPLRISTGQLADRMRQEVNRWMAGNIHFRSVADLSDNIIVHTVSACRSNEELHHILTQDSIHVKHETINEMAHLSQKMDISYFASLH